MSSRISSSRSASANMCSVRQRPIPSAPNSRALAESSGLSAFVRTFRRRMPSAHSRIAAKSSFSCGGTSGTAPTITSPVPPSIVIVSPSWSSWPGRRAVFAAASTCSASQPVTQGVPMPRATTAACEVSPPCAVRIPAACTIPWKSSGVVSQRTRITLSPALPRSSAVSASNTIAPEAAPGEAFSPFATTCTSADGIDHRVEELVELRRVDPADRLLLRDQPLLDHVDGAAQRSGGRPLGVRVCRM